MLLSSQCIQSTQITVATTHSSTGDGTGEVNNTHANRNGADDYMWGRHRKKSRSSKNTDRDMEQLKFLASVEPQTVRTPFQLENVQLNTQKSFFKWFCISMCREPCHTSFPKGRSIKSSAIETMVRWWAG